MSSVEDLVRGDYERVNGQINRFTSAVNGTMITVYLRQPQQQNTVMFPNYRIR
ncbi:hypothetical protein CCACVL1_28113 [Corchorus capsularis]|uniref:Uncharacterized protein n=1 Tax=Corchorus capsularis TaxID=210143 RepID=A0A1R3G7G9_COCAP|nr:hypothetical protein CCACVL1_28113 [Corchorus capsularis]